jgi:hypothetical protein
MSSSPRIYLERCGLRVTLRAQNRPVICPSQNAVIRVPANILPDYQIINGNGSSPDRAVLTSTWPVETPTSVRS